MVFPPWLQVFAWRPGRGHRRCPSRSQVTDARLLERIQGRAIRGIGVEPDIVYQRLRRCGDVFCADVILEVFVVVLQDERQGHAIARCIDAQIARLVNVKPRSLVQQPLGILRRVRFSLEARARISEWAANLRSTILALPLETRRWHCFDSPTNSRATPPQWKRLTRTRSSRPVGMRQP